MTMTEQAQQGERRYTRDETIARIDQANRELQAFLADKSDGELIEPGDDGWSVKDHLAHLAVWMTGLTAMLQREDRAAAMGVSRAAWDADDTDTINAEIYGAWADRSLNDVREALAHARLDLAEALANLSDDDLYRPFSDFVPDAEEQEPIINWVAGNTFGHVEEHLEMLRG
jgi:hypothetical protein